MKRCKSTARAVPAHSSLTSSDLAYDKRFREAFAALPPQVQAQARLAYELFRRDPSHPSLRFKQVHPTRPIFSARVGLAYRALTIRAGGRGDLVLDRIACRLRQPASPVVTLPNKRLKLTGGDRSNGRGVLRAGAHELSVNNGCASGRGGRI